ncbi:MAG TPA: class I SAM-dependent methyltransferase [Acidimicrobiales bacterium]
MSGAPSWDAGLYAQHTAHHRAYDDHVLDQLSILPNLNVLDIGSGAGDLTAKLASLVPGGTVVGIDASLPLVESARERFQHDHNVAFRHLRAQQLGELDVTELEGGLRSGPPFDLVISVATLHWVPRDDHPAVYRAIFELLRDGGTFRADFGGEGQIKDVREVLNAVATELGGAADPWYFPAAEEVAARLIETGFAIDDGFVRLVRQRRSVPDVEAFTGWLESQVLIAYEPSLPGPSYAEFRRQSLERLVERGTREDGSFDQDYIRLDLMVTKPDH